jgi:drug/metabolite transporter (DMT)-like permease
MRSGKKKSYIEKKLYNMKTNTKAYLALAVVCVLWGTTYLAIRVGVLTFPAFLFSGIRQLGAGLILWLILPFLKKKNKLTFSAIVKQVAPGILMIACGNGIITWAEKYIPSGLAALIVSIMPLYITLISLVVVKEKKQFNSFISTGLLLGSIGIVLIFRDNLGDLANSNYLWGVISSFIASLCWAAGTVYMKKNTFTTDSYTNAAIQFTAGGVALLSCSPFLDDLSQLNAITMDSIWALLYLTVFGSIIAFLCYLYALENLPVGLVAVYAYINPFIALVLGFFILDEKITWITALAFTATLIGVYCINKGHAVKTYKKNTIIPSTKS